MPSPKEHTRKGVGLPRQYKRVSSFPIIVEIGSNKRDGSVGGFCVTLRLFTREGQWNA